VEVREGKKERGLTVTRFRQDAKRVLILTQGGKCHASPRGGFICYSSRVPPATDHNLVSVRIDAHRQMSRFFRGINRWTQNFAAGVFQSIAGREQIIDLKIEASPCALALSTAMDSENAASNGQFRHDI
jgi:hypothetical protein